MLLDSRAAVEVGLEVLFAPTLRLVRLWFDTGPTGLRSPLHPGHGRRGMRLDGARKVPRAPPSRDSLQDNCTRIAGPVLVPQEYLGLVASMYL